MNLITVGKTTHTTHDSEDIVVYAVDSGNTISANSFGLHWCISIGSFEVKSGVINS